MLVRCILGVVVFSVAVNGVRMAHAEDPPRVSAATEYQLQNVTPSVKTFQVKVSGTERVQTRINQINEIVQHLVANLRLMPEKMTVPADSEPLPASDVLEVVTLDLWVEYPATEDEALPVTLTVYRPNQKEDRQLFSYDAAQPELFASEMENYLQLRLNLKPKATP